MDILCYPVVLADAILCTANGMTPLPNIDGSPKTHGRSSMCSACHSTLATLCSGCATRIAQALLPQLLTIVWQSVLHTMLPYLVAARKLNASPISSPHHERCASLSLASMAILQPTAVCRNGMPASSVWGDTAGIPAPSSSPHQFPEHSAYHFAWYVSGASKGRVAIAAGASSSSGHLRN